MKCQASSDNLACLPGLVLLAKLVVLLYIVHKTLYPVQTPVCVLKISISSYMSSLKLFTRRCNNAGSIEHRNPTRLIKLSSDARDRATRHRRHHRRLYRLIHSFELPDKQRHRRGTMLNLGSARRWAWYYKDPACTKYKGRPE
jgi:hypothetical protein